MRRLGLVLLIFMLCGINSKADNLEYKVATNDRGSMARSEMIIEIKRGVLDMAEETGIVPREKIKINSESIKALDEKYGLTSVEKLFSGTRKDEPSDIYVFRFSGKVNINDIISEYKKDKSVFYAEPNYVAHVE